MDEDAGFWRSYALPVLVAIGLFCTTNGLWTNPERGLARYVPMALAVFFAGSSVALLLLWRAMRGNRLNHCDVGLAISGWTPPKRLFGLVLVLFFSYGAFTSVESGPKRASQEAAETATTADVQPSVEEPAAASRDELPDPSWSHYCFWFVFLLSASLTELLVFICITFCLSEQYLRRQGMFPLAATGLAAVFASVAFGLYHYSHPEPFHKLVFFPLMPVMLLNITLFVITRNFYLTLLLHNSFAAVGFTELQYSQYPFDPMMDPATYGTLEMMAPNLLAFILPFLLLHLLEGSKVGDSDACRD